MRRQLGLDRVEVAQRVTARLVRRAVDHVHQRGTPLDVAQEVVPEPAALAGTLDQTRYVGHGEDVVSPATTTPRFGIKVVNG